MADDNALKKYYADKFDFHPDKATSEQAAMFDKAVETIENAQAKPYVIQNGNWVENPALVALRQQGLPRKYAQMLSLWKSYRAGMMPDSVDAERLTRGGVPKDQIERVTREREEDFASRAPSAYQMWARDEEEEKQAIKKGKPAPKEQGAEQKPQTPAPEPIQQAVPSEPLPPQQGQQWQASISNGQGEFVPAQLVNSPEEVAQR